MAQIPWQILSRSPIGAPDALRQLRVCFRSIRTAAAAAEGSAASQSLLQHDALGRLKTAHAALSRMLQAETADAEQAAAEVAGEANNCFEQIRIRGTAILSPCFWQVPRLAVYRHVMGFLFKFVTELDGVWLAFTETRPATVSKSSNTSTSGIPTSKRSRSSSIGALGFLLPDIESNDGTIFVSVETTALVFRPKVGDLITCETQTVRPAVLRLLWLGHFTAIISREHLGDRFRYLEEAKVYVHRKDKTRRIAEKAFVRMHVIEVPKSQSGDRVAIRGSLLARGSGPLVQSTEAEAAGAIITGDAAAAESETADAGVEAANAEGATKHHKNKRKIQRPATETTETASSSTARAKYLSAAVVPQKAVSVAAKSSRRENGREA
ncbi:hypothetical protein, conserved [Eimeria tenella]|uniref:Uncharacterized protein n=1 Tax=Eimeria tenella TaxID=5802 RepID=U6L900_EIMTE|nr:hypothetical protein, conserved [Eimeria tenella]CDJ45014.1 hypothetical protein, conserved [Eimeria tenella]|eukprot:XP_013235761.1 hypothetical protein, conserved [Eimeria tenella]